MFIEKVIDAITIIVGLLALYYIPNDLIAILAIIVLIISRLML